MDETRTPEPRITELMRQEFSELFEPGKSFKPCAIYHENLDMLEILTEDCSVCAEMVEIGIDLLTDNNHPDGLPIGLSILGLKTFCERHEILYGPDRAVNVDHVLEVMQQEFPQITWLAGFLRLTLPRGTTVVLH
jgi:hypothetical protein